MSQKIEKIHLGKYQQIKELFPFPLKIKIFFSLLEHCYRKDITPEASKDLEKKYKKIIHAFKHQTS